MKDQIHKLIEGRHHDPFAILGFHHEPTGSVIREYLPTAVKARVVEFGPMTRINGSNVWEIKLNAEITTRPLYHIHWSEQDGRSHQSRSPYSFDPLIGDLDLHWFNEGRHLHAYRFLGAHLREVDGVEGCHFALWAPGVQRVSVVGDFNNWHGLRHQMRNRGHSGVWEIFIPGLCKFDSYKFELLTVNNELLHKSDPYARATALRPETVSLIPARTVYQWQDQQWISHRNHWDWQQQPISIYEVHLGSWRRNADKTFLTWNDFVDQLIPHVQYLGFTHIELLPIAEHPLDESWGYQVTNYFSPTSRYGSADELRYFIDQCHQANIGVLLDWVPAHFPKDRHALAEFTGKALYEYDDPKKAEHLDWGTLIFDYGRNEVISFLLSNAIYWLEEFHFDGLRVDAVASMLYLDYSRQPGDWVPNQYGGRENLEAVDFFKRLNEELHKRFPGTMTIAEESTAWPMVSRPTYMGGLGFSMKWNMGWMHDTLEYFREESVNRKYHQERLTFGQLYTYTENFILPLSHDEVVHLKGSLISKMTGDHWQQFANLRLLLAYQFLYPGKKLIFMGAELAQWSEWNANGTLDWILNEYTNHNAIGHLLSRLNHLYRNEKALYERDFTPEGFSWIDCHDHLHSLLSFYRHDNNNKGSVICLFNFTPVPRYNYRLGVSEPGQYKELLNTDSTHFGGSDLGNGGTLETQPEGAHEYAHSLSVTIPPLAALVLKKQA